MNAFRHVVSCFWFTVGGLGNLWNLGNSPVWFRGLGFGVWGLGFGVWVWGFDVLTLSSLVRNLNLDSLFRLRLQVSWFGVSTTSAGVERMWA
jgi:hypothetical protein